MGEYIEWSKVPRSGRVRLVGKVGTQSYVYRGKTVIWSSYNAFEAQSYLSSLVRRKPKLKVPKASRLPQIPSQLKQARKRRW